MSRAGTGMLHQKLAPPVVQLVGLHYTIDFYVHGQLQHEPIGLLRAQRRSAPPRMGRTARARLLSTPLLQRPCSQRASRRSQPRPPRRQRSTRHRLLNRAQVGELIVRAHV